MKKLVLVLLVAGLGWLPGLSAAAFQEGVHYIEIPFSEPLDTGKKIEVREFFWYGCGHCFRFEPLLRAWLKKKPKNVVFVTTPAFLPRRMAHAKAYYAFEAMGKLDKLHGAFFEAIHIHQSKVDDESSIATFVSQQGADEKAFRKAYKSFSVDHQVKQAMQLATKYGINSVPTLVVDGRYLVTASYAGSNEKMLQVIDELIKKISKTRK